MSSNALSIMERQLITLIAIAVGHDNEVECLVYSPDSKWVATGSKDSTIIVWGSDGQVIHEWIAHVESVRSLAFSPDSRYLASAGIDMKVAIWDLGQGAQKVAMLEGHTGEVNSCAWSPDGTVIASGDSGGEVRLWERTHTDCFTK